MLKTNLTKSVEYLLVSINVFEENSNISSEYKNIKKYRNKMVKISAKLKNQNLPKFRSRDLFSYKNFVKVQSTSSIRKPNI